MAEKFPGSQAREGPGSRKQEQPPGDAATKPGTHSLHQENERKQTLETAGWARRVPTPGESRCCRDQMWPQPGTKMRCPGSRGTSMNIRGATRSSGLSPGSPSCHRQSRISHALQALGAQENSSFPGACFQPREPGRKIRPPQHRPRASAHRRQRPPGGPTHFTCQATRAESGAERQRSRTDPSPLSLNHQPKFIFTQTFSKSEVRRKGFL